MTSHIYNDLVKCPLFTQKSSQLLNNNQYCFLVSKKLDKISIKKAFEEVFNIKVLSINVLTLPNKKKRVGNNIGNKSKYKKAIIFLAPGNSLAVN